MSTAPTVRRMIGFLEMRRDRRREQAALRHSLSTYTTRADTDDLLAMFDRFDGDQVDNLRSIVNEQALQRQRSRSFVWITP
jgi:hypothetical protein